MPVDLQDPRTFYKTPLGRTVQDLLCAHLLDLCPSLSDERLLPLGCGDALLGSLPTVCAHMTSAVEEGFVAIVDSAKKPLPNESIDRVVALHAVDTANELEKGFFLREIWRVLKGEGHLTLIMPKPRSAWAENLKTPFAQDPAFSSSRIRALLDDQDFSVEHLKRALYASPVQAELFPDIAKRTEKIAPWLCLWLSGGVWIIDAQKRELGLARARKARKEETDPLLPLLSPV